MQILLCAATEMEIASTIKFLRANNFPVEVLITGVGLPEAVYKITKKVCLQKPAFLVQAGIAGCFNKQLLLGDVVVIESDTIGDLGVQEKHGFYSVFDMGFTCKNEWPWYDGKLSNGTKEYRHAGLPIVDAVTVNEITTHPVRIKYFKEELHAAVETMEGAALHYVGLMEGIPFMQIRSLSNYVGERDKTKWDLQGAVTNLNTELQRLFINHFTT